jgi:hypothetical protein
MGGLREAHQPLRYLRLFSSPIHLRNYSKFSNDSFSRSGSSALLSEIPTTGQEVRALLPAHHSGSAADRGGDPPLVRGSVILPAAGRPCRIQRTM